MNHIRLVDPADIQLLAQTLLAYSCRIEAERDRSTAPSRLAGYFCFQSWDDRELGRLARAFDDKRRGKVEGVDARDAGIEGGWIGYFANGVMAEKGVVAGFDCEDGSRTLYYLRVRESETRNNVDDSTDADGRDYIGQSKEFVRGADWESVFARRKGRRLVRFQYVLGRLHMNDFLRMHALDDIDGVVVLVMSVPIREVVQTFKEELRLHILEEVDALEIDYGGGGNF